MDLPEKTVHRKIQDIVEKLQKLDCTILGNKQDSWIMELLFKPGFHRCHLIEWILSKLGYDIGRISGPQISEGERMKNLQTTISDLGICRQNSHDVIKGTATMKEQLVFWDTLVNIIWFKYEITMNTSMSETDEGIALSPEKRNRKLIDEEFEEACSFITEICESVNIKHLFKCDINLLAPDVEREVKNISFSKSEVQKVPNLQELKEMAKKKGPDVNLQDQCQMLLLNKMSIEENENGAISDAVLNQSEEELRKVSVDLQNNAYSNFSDVYNDLKPLILHAKADEFTDVGPAFKKLEPFLESFLQLKKSFPKLESSNSKLLEINLGLEELISQETLVDSNFASILKLVKE